MALVNSMNFNELLKCAYETVAFGADKTWRYSSLDFYRPYLKLYMTEQETIRWSIKEMQPRTVQDSIPQSRLARYSNYEYDRSRELSYTDEPYRYEDKSEPDEENIWTCKEVDRLFKFYTERTAKVINKKATSSHYESPFMRAKSLSEYILKQRIVNGQVKKLWNVQSGRNFQSKEANKSILICKWSEGDVLVSEPQSQVQQQQQQQETTRRKLYSSVLQGTSVTAEAENSDPEDVMTVL